MAHSVYSLLNKTSGNVGNHTFYSLNSQPVIRRRVKNIANPRTEKQQANRSNLSFVIYAFRILRPLLIISLNNRLRSRSAYNEFLSRNLNHSIINGLFFPEKLKISTDDIPSTDFQVNRLVNESNKFQLSWNEVLSENQSDEDILCAVIYTGTNKRFHYLNTDITRNTQNAALIFTLNFHTVACYLYLFFVRPDYSISSKISVQTFDAIN